ncbi:MAG: hypothetical protein IPL31_02055 [Saprospiraceae bacterium]|nr:hypothetical protein [Saprospiraceae bacterium]
MRLILFILLTYNTILKAYVGSYEIITIRSNKQIYYLKIDSRYDSISKDFNYFDHSGTFIESISDRIKVNFRNNNNFKLFKYLEIINLKAFREYAMDNKLFILKSEVLHLPSGITDDFKIINAFHANTYGYTYSEDLLTEDNEWIKPHIIIKLWTFKDDDGYCHMNLYGPKNSLTHKQFEFYKNKINKTGRSIYDPEFVNILKILYRKKVIMIGQCSC